MIKNKKDIIRNVRIDTALDTALKIIANYEDRTISNIIQRLLKDAVINYIHYDYEFVDYCLTLEKADIEAVSVFYPEIMITYKNKDYLTRQDILQGKDIQDVINELRGKISPPLCDRKK